MNHQSTAALSILTLFGLLLAGPARAANEPYYTWTDDNGVPNYSQQDPKNGKATLVTEGQPTAPEVEQLPIGGQRPGQVAAPAESVPEATQAKASARSAAQEADANTKTKPGADPQLDKERQAVQAEIAQLRASNCNIGRRNLAKLEAFARIKITDKDGTDHLLSDEEKQSRIADAKKTIAENCGGG